MASLLGKDLHILCDCGTVACLQHRVFEVSPFQHWRVGLSKSLRSMVFLPQLRGAKADNFLVGDVNQLQPLAFMEAAQKAKVPVTFRPESSAGLFLIPKSMVFQH